MNRLILVGIDGSEPSDTALRWASREAIRRTADILLLHAAPWPLVDLPVDPGYTEAWEGAKRLLADVEQRTRQFAAGIEVRSELVGESPAAALIGRAADAALVVVGNRGHGGFVGLLLGSTALQVAGHAPCPVALVKAASLGRDGGPVVVGVGSGEADAQLEVAFREAALRGRRLRAITAWSLLAAAGPADMVPRAADLRHIPSDLEERLAGLLIRWQEKYPGVVVESQVINDRARHALIEASAEAELLVVGRHDEGGGHILALGSVASAVVHHAGCPVLIAP